MNSGISLEEFAQTIMLVCEDFPHVDVCNLRKWNHKDGSIQLTVTLKGSNFDLETLADKIGKYIPRS